MVPTGSTVVKQWYYYSHFLPWAASCAKTASSTSRSAQSCSKLRFSDLPMDCASVASCVGLGTSSATTWSLLLSPYTQMFSTSEQVFSSASTLPRLTYSPACSFTRSFLRSATYTQLLHSILYLIGAFMILCSSYVFTNFYQTILDSINAQY